MHYLPVLSNIKTNRKIEPKYFSLLRIHEFYHILYFWMVNECCINMKNRTATSERISTQYRALSSLHCAHRKRMQFVLPCFCQNYLSWIYATLYSLDSVAPRKSCSLCRTWVSTGAKGAWHLRNFWTVLPDTRGFWQFYYKMLFIIHP